MRSLKSLIDEFESSDIKVNVVLEKKSTMLELVFKHEGTNVPCDLTSEDFDLPIQGEIISSVWRHL
jgi:hypothetical protein